MTDEVKRWTRERAAAWMVGALALASSIVGVVNWFTYDDRYIVELNPAMHDMAHWWRAFMTSYWPRDWGGDGYRPVTMLMFRTETWFGNGIPLPFHIANILLYVAVAVMVFHLAKRLLPFWAAALVGALFAVHPVHVEAVANIVGQSELLVAITTVPAIILYLRDRSVGPLRVKTAIAIAVLYALSAFSKEHGIVLPAILLAAELTILDDGRPIMRRVRKDRYLRIFYLSMAVVGLSYIGVRSIVLRDHGLAGFQPFMPFATLHTGTFDRILTAISIVPEWFRLFLWPARLAPDYGPPQIQIAQGVALWQLPGFLLLVGTLAIGVALRRSRPVISFGIAFICIALLPSSNFIVPAGIVLAERTLFTPSIGAMIAVGGVAVAMADWLRARNRLDLTTQRVAAAFAAVIVLLGAARSYTRTQVWKDNETLFNQAVIDAPNSYRAHYMLGAWSFEKERKRIGEAEYRKAMSLFPYDPFLSYNMAEQYKRVGMCREAVPFYRWSRSIKPDFPLGRAAFAHCLLEVGQYDEAKKMALEAMSVGGELVQARRLVFLADSAKRADTGVREPGRVGLAGSPSKLR